VSFIYDIIQERAFLNGAKSITNLHTLVKTQASDFCKINYANSDKCKELLKKTWVIVISLEAGANIDDVCNEIGNCDVKKPLAIATKDTNLTTYAIAFCTEWRSNKPDSVEFCAKFGATIKSVVSSVIAIARNGNVMSEIAKCSPGTHSLGCYLRKSPPSVKLIVALLSSMMPSSSALKRKIQSKYFQEPKSLSRQCPFGDPKPSDSKPTTSDLGHLREVCQSACNVVTKTSLSSYVESIGFSPDYHEQMVATCHVLNVTQPEKCNKATSKLKDFLSTFLAQVAHQFCAKNICSAQDVNSMIARIQKRCRKRVSSNGVLKAIDARSFTNAAEKIKVIDVVWMIGLLTSLIFGIW